MQNPTITISLATNSYAMAVEHVQRIRNVCLLPGATVTICKQAEMQHQAIIQCPMHQLAATAQSLIDEGFDYDL